MVKLDEAVKAANIERVRLAHIHNEEANKSRDKPEKWVRTLEAFAEERGDTKALAAFAKEREAGQVRGSAGRPPRGPRST